MPTTLPQRTMSWNRTTRMLTLSIPKSSKRTEVVSYQIESIQPDEGFWDHPVRCFRVTNQTNSEVYDVVIDCQEAEEISHSCDCPGFSAHGHKGVLCKHIASLLTLVKTDRV